MARFRILEADLLLRVGDVEVTIDDSDPRSHATKLNEALHHLLTDRLTLLDTKGARGAGDLEIETTRVISWDGL